MVLVGHVARPHGRFGRVLVNAATDFPHERFAPGAVLHVRSGRGEERLTVAGMQMHLGRPLVAFEGIDTLDQAEQLSGAELRVPEAELARLPDGTYYEHALVGCEVVTVDGRMLGPVRAIEGGAGGARLILGEGRGEIQIPLAHDICVSVDIDQRRIVVNPPEGLLDLNA